MYVSLPGNAAAEARAGGADEETALLYGVLSGSIEVLTEQIGGGIPGLNKGTLDNWLMGMAQSNTGRAALKHLVNALGEGAEEFVSEITGTYLAQMWNDDEPDFWQTLKSAAAFAALSQRCRNNFLKHFEKKLKCKRRKRPDLPTPAFYKKLSTNRAHTNVIPISTFTSSPISSGARPRNRPVL